MTKKLTYVDLNAPDWESRQFSAGFDGSGSYLRRYEDFYGSADSKKWTFSCWVYVNSGIGGRLLAGTSTVGGGAANARTRAILSNSLNDVRNAFQLLGLNSAGTQIVSLISSPLAAGQWYHCVASFDLEDETKRHLYINGVSDLQVQVYTNDTVDFTLADWAVGGLPDGTALLNGNIAELWHEPGVYMDLSNRDIRERFTYDPPRPKYLGTNGENPTGSSPLVYLSRQGGLGTFETNRGTGGGLVQLGSLYDVNHGIIDQIYRFSAPTNYLPKDISGIPSIESVNFSPRNISLGGNLGERSDLKVAFSDHRHIFQDESYNSGTFFGKWRARYETKLIGKRIVWFQGDLGQTLGEMEARHFIVESTEGPTFDGRYIITAKDVLKLADGDRAQAPALSNGFLTTNISSSSTTATLSPSGIGDDEYPSSGYVAFGGEEICSFTRSGDTLTISRAELGTTAQAHEAGDRIQVVLRYSGEDPGDIIRDLLINYAGVSESYIYQDAWRAETDSFLQRLYTATIAEPTSVNKLVSEIIEQSALAVWWDAEEQLIRLQVLRPIATDVTTFDQDNIIEGSLQINEQPSKRISQVWTYFGQRNPLLPLDEKNNFRSVEISADLDSESDYGTAKIKKIFSRWIPFGARSVAARVNSIQLGRFVDPPRKFKFSLSKGVPGQIKPVLGGGYRVQAWPLQTQTGAQTNSPVQVTRLNPRLDRYEVEAEEMLFEEYDFTPPDLLNRVVIIDSDINNINLREIHDQIYPDPEYGTSPTINVTFYIETGVTVGSLYTGAAAMYVGSWPSDFPVTIYVRGRIQGAGGKGGQAGTNKNRNAQGGFDGGPALYTRKAINLILNEGAAEIWGGGGGGAGGKIKDSGKQAGGGGGGAGTIGGAGGPFGNGSVYNNGEDGTRNAAGDGGPSTSGEAFPGANGGYPGKDGYGNGTRTGGNAGNAIDGISYITKTGSGDIRGDEVN